MEREPTSRNDFAYWSSLNEHDERTHWRAKTEIAHDSDERMLFDLI